MLACVPYMCLYMCAYMCVYMYVYLHVCIHMYVLICVCGGESAVFWIIPVSMLFRSSCQQHSESIPIYTVDIYSIYECIDSHGLRDR